MRSYTPLVVLLVVAGCGGSPSSPTPPRTLAPGRYSLRVESGPVQVTSGNASSSIFMCMGRPDNAATVMVDIVADGAGWRGTVPGATLTITLQPSGADLCGPIDGTATATDGTTVQFGKASLIKSPSSDGSLCGKFSAVRVVGTITADVTFLYPTAAVSFGSCSGNSFTLTPA